MTFETWDNLINHLLVLTATRKFEAQAHTLYVSDMFAELQKYSDEDVSIAARAIVENENLYGNYPPLAVWLKYIPQKRAENNAVQQKIQDFLDWISDGMHCDRFLFDPQDWVNDGIKNFGEETIRKIVGSFGGFDRIIRAHGTSEYNQREILSDARRAIENYQQDKKLSVPEIASQPDLKRIK